MYNGIKREITRTYYDRTKFSNIQAGFAQENLRPRVASVTYQDIEGVNYDRATHYSYDVHGNVKNLIQEISANGVTLKKRMDYDYDLVSGKVNFMYYQKNQADQFIHKYEYDGDNRIVKVFTSRDAITWDRDAKYDYYAHGPLAQTTIGEHGVETNTYAYTIQGWIKGMNGASFSYALGYFDETVIVGTESKHYTDYTSIGTSTALGTPIATGKSLYNGNIATMASNTPYFATDPDQYGPTTWTQQFEYDQLNRIKQSSSLGWVVNGQAVPDAFKTAYEYDAGGNITNLHRWDKDGGQFDAMKYNYENTASTQNYKTNTNKLIWVDDTEPFADYASDIDDQDVANYTYDEIGQLISDKSEEIEKIEWTNNGKVSKVTRTGSSIKPDLEFGYDAMGSRVFKSVKSKGGALKNIFYMKDASGNVLSIYETNNGSSATLAEQFVYGSSRIGTFKPLPSNSVNSHLIGLKEYEITDHLGNMRVTLGDKVNGGNGVVVNAYDYFPFGMIARGFGSKSRYGYQKQEIDQELWSGAVSYKYRIEDTRIGRFFSVDPLAPEYAHNSTYAFSENSVINSIELEGLERLVVTNSTLFTDMVTVRKEAASSIAQKIATAGVIVWNPIASKAVGEVERGGTNISSVSSRISRHVAENGNMSTGDAEERNAFRHVLWSAAITNAFDAEIAINIGDAHEGIKVAESGAIDFSQALVQDRAAVDEVVDFLNNGIGRGIATNLGEGVSQVDIAREVLRVQRDEGLWGVNVAKDGTMSISKNKITQEQFNIATQTLNTLDENGFTEADRQAVQADNDDE